MRTRVIFGLAALAAGALALRRRQRSLEGQVALVTGGSRGLGFLIARALLDAGCRVAICARDVDNLERAERKLSRHGRVAALTCDVSDSGAVDEMVRNVVRRFGTLDILVNNAAIIQVGPAAALTPDDFERALDAAFRGTVNTTLAAVPIMRAAGGGSIANITSIGGQVAVPHLLPYDCAKFAAVGFSEGMRAELARDGIRVTTVIPGLMRTGSPLHVPYKGDAAGEFRWFAAGDVLPFLSTDADRAAARIVRAIRRGETLVTITLSARLLRLVHAVAPAATTRVLGVVNRLLPRDSTRREVKGEALLDHLPTRWLRSRLLRAAREANQPGPFPTFI